jgi:iron complex transport system ATP-binding protein
VRDEAEHKGDSEAVGLGARRCRDAKGVRGRGAAGVSALAIEHVSVELGGRNVVDNVSFAVEPGEWVTMIGPNGAGKTTLLRAISGLVSNHGTITVAGVPARRLRRRELAQRVAVVPQSPVMPRGMTVREYVLLGRTPYVSYAGREGRRDHAAVEQALARLDLVDLAPRPLGTLSGGESQRAVLARALAQEARLLLLDEPTSALDAGRQQEALELIDLLRLEAGLTVVAAMHDLTLAGLYASRLLLLSAGRIVAQGGPAEVLTEPLIAEHYGARVRVLDGAVIPVRG